MLRLHPSKILLTIDEIHRVLERHNGQLVPSISTTSLASSTYWDESPLAIEDSKSYGKQRKGRHPPGPLDLSTALTGLRLSTPTNSEPDLDNGYTAEDSEEATPMPIDERQRDAYFDTVRRSHYSGDVDGSNDEEFHRGSSVAGNRMDDVLSIRSESSASEHAYSNAVSPMEYATPPRSNSSRIAHWLDRAPRPITFGGRNTFQHADLNIWNNQDPSDREFRFDAGAESDASSYLADGEDNENVTETIADPFTANGRARAAEDQVPNPMDTLRTALRDFQLDGVNDDSDEDEERRGMMLETPARSPAISRVPSRTHIAPNQPTVDTPTEHQTIGHLSRFPGPFRSPLVDPAALRLSFRDPTDEDTLAMGQLGNNIHRFINNAARRNRIIPETILDDEYEGDSEDNFQSDYFDVGSERRSQLQEDAARRTIR